MAAADSAAANAAFSLVAADGFEGFAPCIAMLHHVKASPKCKVALARDNDDAMEKLGNKKVTPSQNCADGLYSAFFGFALKAFVFSKHTWFGRKTRIRIKYSNVLIDTYHRYASYYGFFLHLQLLFQFTSKKIVDYDPRVIFMNFFLETVNLCCTREKCDYKKNKRIQEKILFFVFHNHK